MTSKVVGFCRSAVLIAGICLSGAIAAQTVSEGPAEQAVPSTANLDLPQNLQIFGKADPNVRKPTAIVNGYVITRTEVDQRFNLIVGLQGFNLSAEEANQLRLQILRQLTDETIQIQEAKANDISIGADQIDRSFVGLSQRFKRTPDEMRKWLRDIGSSERSLRRQIEGELAWQRVIQRKVSSFINVSDDEINGIIARLKAAQGTDEFNLREIYISATPERSGEVYRAMQQMIQQMQQGRPFEYFARFSEASTKATGGDLGWVRAPMLPAPIAAAVAQMQVGQVAGPIEIPGGFSVLYLVDKRQVLTADPRDARLSLRQITVKFATGTTQAQAQARAGEFAKVLQSTNGCGAVGKAAEALGAEVVDNDAVRVRDLPPQLQDIVLNLQVGQATPPFGSPSEGVRALVLCGRDDPREAGLPSTDQIREGLEESRTNLRAQRLLRDLRRDAIIEYR
ncbi:peptidylprolyl isomerase [Sphingomonas turrisvirgatae]|uniref:Parvulin-like PPIase n=1 Tax=Sphingomonas turrisvirgatae TaxID=1888892 RepID=A0A1E3LRM1_9SPHN|nr:peptidylprolyl isomerase [Sphingomonas turrisvirgatae]ODP36412.1 peptidylprolyl isomerase [Sphingomonas turrisvirgatae]